MGGKAATLGQQQCGSPTYKYKKKYFHNFCVKTQYHSKIFGPKFPAGWHVINKNVKRCRVTFIKGEAITA